MRELSSYLLDVMESAVRAGARSIVVSVDVDARQDLLTIVVEDDCPGVAASPFFATTFRLAAERTGGSTTIGASSLGGTAVVVTMRSSRVDRRALAGLPATVLSMVLTHREIDVRCLLTSGARELCVSSTALCRELGVGDGGSLEVAMVMGERLRAGLEELEGSAS